eukprot:357951-Chlamydomonas_euryale.AAC.9
MTGRAPCGEGGYTLGPACGTACQADRQVCCIALTPSPVLPPPSSTHYARLARLCRRLYRWAEGRGEEDVTCRWNPSRCSWPTNRQRTDREGRRARLELRDGVGCCHVTTEPHA